MLGLITMLVDPQAFAADGADAFDVIDPSLPGYGYSDRPIRPGMNLWTYGVLPGGADR